MDTLAAGNDEAEPESVFVSSPADYFDPSSFLTRSALSEPDELDTAEETLFQSAIAEELSTQIDPDPETEPDSAPEAAPDTETESAVAALFDSQDTEIETDAEQPNDFAFPGLEFKFTFGEPQANADNSEPADSHLDFSDNNPEPSNEVEQELVGAPGQDRDIFETAGTTAPDFDTSVDSAAIEQESVRESGKEQGTQISVQATQETEDNDLDTASEIVKQIADSDEQAPTVFEASSITQPEEELSNSAAMQDDITDQSAVEEADEEADQSDAIRQRALRAQLEDEEALESIPQENLSVLGRLSTPLELLSGKETSWGQRIGLMLTILVLIGTLAIQYLWQQRAIYSQQADYRSIYEWACQWLTCDLQPLRQIAAIQSDNLIIRAHPEIDNALAVNITMHNGAEFPQPFPVMILSFQSANNATIALREFAPHEYLSAGLSEVELMPVMAPVEIELELIDPGPDAVNYTLAFRSP